MPFSRTFTGCDIVSQTNQGGTVMSNSGAGVFFVVAVVGAIWYYESDLDWIVTNRAEGRYHLGADKIAVHGKRPHDCDFMTAPLGSKNCHYEREYAVEWLALSGDSPPRSISYGTMQAEPPSKCSPDVEDFAHKCYYVSLGPDEHATNVWSARKLEIKWLKVDD
jgi:hypothetical protein